MTAYTVSSYAELVDAINNANASAADDTITLTADILLTGDLPVIGVRQVDGTVVPSGALTLQSDSGHHYQISGEDTYSVLFVSAGMLDVVNVDLVNGVARGGNGGIGTFFGGGVGGGLGAGGALFVNSGASVRLTGVSFAGNAAVG